MVTGEPKAVAERLLEMKAGAEADEIVVVTPSLDRDRRTGSLRPWRRLAQGRLIRAYRADCAGSERASSWTW